jgi:cell division protein ZapA (FtsZ GTPase activity inhibitor)
MGVFASVLKTVDTWVSAYGVSTATLVENWLHTLTLIFTLVCLFNLTQAIEDIAKSLNDIRVCVRDRNLNLCEVFKELKQQVHPASHTQCERSRRHNSQDNMRRRVPSPTASISAADPL